jgi:hypothetical protein
MRGWYGIVGLGVAIILVVVFLRLRPTSSNSTDEGGPPK